MGKVVTREWRKAKVLNWNLYSFQLLEIIQVLDSISWVRCASGNVLVLSWDFSQYGSCAGSFYQEQKMANIGEFKIVSSEIP